MTPQQGWVILTCLSSLQECVLRMTGLPPANPPTPHAPTTLPALRSLKVYRDKKSSNPEDVAPLFRSLTLPALEELTFSTDDAHISHFLAFMTRSSCPLARLLADCTLSTPNFALLFAALPHVSKFTMDIPVHCLGAVSSILAAQNGHLPLLRELIVGLPPVACRSGDSALDYHLLIDMLQSRSEGGATAGITPLKNFKLQGSDSHLAFLASFDALEQQGMHIVFEP
ncbi:hypothetical protein C8J57DRAFT_363091 [Mycena rebaudengoi]|nr:hypothetical protein C8J57DRAFT_363091 [Mycena rebaudengoi]